MTTPRAAWKGHLKLALVSCPVRLVKATGQVERLPSHFLHRDTLNRIQMVPHDPTLGKVCRRDLVTGYQCEDDRYVVLSEGDLAEIKSPSDKTLLIESFVDSGEVDSLYFDQAYFLAPDGVVAVEVFDVLRAAMSARSKAAIARIVLHRRERMATIAVRGRGFVLTTLHGADEVRDPGSFFDSVPNGDPSIELLNLAQQLIAMRSGRFDPKAFRDRYQAALRSLIEQKAASGETTAPDWVIDEDEAGPPEVLETATNLAEAFRQSVASQRKPPARSRTRRSPSKPAAVPAARISETSSN